MTDFHLTAVVSRALPVMAWLCAGALIGTAHFLTLRWNVGLLVFGRVPFVAAAMQIARFLLLAGLLATIAYCSAPLPLIAATAGILAARTMMILRLGAPT